MRRLTISLLLFLCLLFSFQAYGQIEVISAGGSSAVTETATTYTITKTNIVLAGAVTVTSIEFVTAVATTSITVGDDVLNKDGSVIWIDASGGTGNATIASDQLTFSDFSGGVDVDGDFTAGTATIDAGIISTGVDPAVTNVGTLGNATTIWNTGTSGTWTLGDDSDDVNGTLFLVSANNSQGNFGITDADLLGINGFVKVLYRLDQNSSTEFAVVNNTGGTNAQATFSVESNSSKGTFVAIDDGYTVLTEWADKFVVNATGTAAALLLSTTNAAGEIQFYIGGTTAGDKKVVFDANGSVTINGTLNFAADSQGDDDYEIALPNILALVSGLSVTFTANTANTDGATLEITSVGDLDAIVIADGASVATALATGEILAGQTVTVVFDGTNWQVTSRLAADRN